MIENVVTWISARHLLFDSVRNMEAVQWLLFDNVLYALNLTTSQNFYTCNDAKRTQLCLHCLCRFIPGFSFVPLRLLILFYCWILTKSNRYFCKMTSSIFHVKVKSYQTVSYSFFLIFVVLSLYFSI